MCMCVCVVGLGAVCVHEYVFVCVCVRVAAVLGAVLSVLNFRLYHFLYRAGEFSIKPFGFLENQPPLIPENHSLL